MDRLDFLRRILPAVGSYASIVIEKGYTRQAFYSSIEALDAGCKTLDAAGRNVYYAISSYKTTKSRTQENALATKALILDLDCGVDKPYTSQAEGIAALAKFIKLMSLPAPLVVSSGRGLHVYWVMESELPAEEWTQLARAFKAATVKHNLETDAAPTANCALVLRPIGTHNPKGDLLVRVLLDSPPTTRAILAKVLEGYAPTDIPVMATQVPDRLKGRTTGLLASLSNDQEFPAALPDVVVSKCAQVRWAVANQDKVSEPTWYNLLGVAAHCVNPEDTAIAWSKDHSDFDADTVLKKLHHWKSATTGPTTCIKFKSDRPKGCDKCRMLGKLGSPAMLGAYREPISAASDSPDAISHEIPIPKPYKRTNYGIVVVLENTDIEICPFEIYPVGYGRDEALGYETVRYKWKRPHLGWQDLIFRQAYLNDESREFSTTIADQGIMLPKGKAQVEGFRHMLRAYMDTLRSRKTITNIHSSMGWKDDFTKFVVGDRVYCRDDKGKVTIDTTTLSAATGRLGHELYTHAGTVAAWKAGTALLEAANMPYHMFALSQGFAAPLWALTGLKGITISLCGKSGGGKSLLQLWQQSIWGDPSALHLSAKFTQNALFSRMGMYNNLPMTIDEVTLMEDKDVGEFCYWVTQGRDKARLTRTSEERDVKQWATTVTVSTNISLAAKLISSGLDTDAQMARLLEVNIPPHSLFYKSSDAGRTVFNYITENHGVAGDKYIQALLRIGKAGLKARIAMVTAEFSTMYSCKFTGVERYWEQTLILLHVACEIATEEGLIAYNYRAGIVWAIEQLMVTRTVAAENSTDCFDLVTQYLNEHAADVLTVMNTKGMAASTDPNRLPRGKVAARFDIYRGAMDEPFSSGTVMIIRKPFRYWLSSKGYDYNTLLKEIKSNFADATPPGKRFSMGRGTTLKIGQHYVVGISLMHDRMLPFLDLTRQEALDAPMGKVVNLDVTR